MLTTYQDIYQAVQKDMNIEDEVPLFPLARVKNVVNRAYVKAHSLFKWPGTEWAKTTTTQANLEYYDKPSDFKDDAIFRLEVDGDQYGETPDGSPLRFEDYRIWRADDDNANSTAKKWSVYQGKIFIWPIPTASGLEICAWGQKVPDALTADGDTTIFSYDMPEGNEAIALESTAILKGQGEEEDKGQFRSNEAKQILVVAWNKIRQNQAKYEKLQPFFEVEDMFSPGSGIQQDIGNFGLNN